MGLDMYLNKKIYVGAQYEHRNVVAKVHITVDGKPLKIDVKKISYVEEQAAYWRKANAIHNWFVRNIQGDVDNCGEYYVSRQQLQELYDTVCEVLTHKKTAGKILPPASGFFFGSTDIDEWYWQDMEYTKKVLGEILKAPDTEPVDYYYHASW